MLLVPFQAKFTPQSKESHSPQLFVVEAQVASLNNKIVLYCFIFLSHKLSPQIMGNMIRTVSAYVYSFVAPRFCSTFTGAKWVMKLKAIHFQFIHLETHKDLKSTRCPTFACSFICQCAVACFISKVSTITWNHAHQQLCVATSASQTYTIAFLVLRLANDQKPLHHPTNRKVKLVWLIL